MNSEGDDELARHPAYTLLPFASMALVCGERETVVTPRHSKNLRHTDRCIKYYILADLAQVHHAYI